MDFSVFYPIPPLLTPYLPKDLIFDKEVNQIFKDLEGIIRPLAKRFHKFSKPLNYSQIFSYLPQSLVFPA